MKLILAAAIVTSVQGFYLPGVSPTDYSDGDDVPVWVNALSSDKTLTPYDFYNSEFNFCGSEGSQGSVSESLGSILFGDRLYQSTINLKMQKEENVCKLWCEKTITAENAAKINERIVQNYKFDWFIDGLPAATTGKDTHASGEDSKYYMVGFPLGEVDKKQQTITPYLHNSYKITVQVHKDTRHPLKPYRVVGVLVNAVSVASTIDDSNACMPGSAKLQLSEKAENKVKYYYSVEWQESTTTWGTRWDHYLHTFDPKIHWFSLINSIVIVVILMAMVAMILLRALHKDISRYNQLEASEDAQEDFGWKLVHGDVFRPPTRYMLLSVLAGSGTQLFIMVLVTLVFAALGLLSPSYRGALSTVMLVFFILFSTFAGYVSARLYKMFGGENWKKCVMLTAFLVPGTTFSIFIFLNFILIGAHSSGAVPFLTMFAVISMWFLVSAPLCFVGAYFGFKKPKIEQPVRTNQIPRQVPEQIFYLRKFPSIMMGGILPFGAIFIELFFIMQSIWHHQVYYVFGFLFLVFMVLVMTCSGVTILLCYFHLCSEDYHWWWRSFMTSGAASIYIFLYSILYYYTKLNIGTFSSMCLYFGWTFTISMLFFVLSGTIGFLSCLYFVRVIFSSIKID